jgi:hypothetical protein
MSKFKYHIVAACASLLVCLVAGCSLTLTLSLIVISVIVYDMLEVFLYPKK